MNVSYLQNDNGLIFFLNTNINTCMYIPIKVYAHTILIF